VLNLHIAIHKSIINSSYNKFHICTSLLGSTQKCISSVGVSLCQLNDFTFQFFGFLLRLTITGNEHLNIIGGHRGRDHMVVGFITTNAISAYHH